MHRLEIKSPIYNCSIPLERRITIIRGDSGTGKSIIVEMLTANLAAIEVNSTLDYVVVNRTTIFTIMNTEYSHLIIMDDLEVVASNEFSLLVSQTEARGNYYLIISREDPSVQLDLNAFSISMNSIYNFKKHVNNIDHLIINKYTSVSVVDPDCVLIEDSAAGFTFFKEFFLCHVEKTSDKGSIINLLSELVSLGFRRILIIMDSAAFGCHVSALDAIIDLLSKDNENLQIGYFADYESFEYFLLSTNFFKHDSIVLTEMNDLTKYANKYISWENYFEDLLARVSKNYMYKHLHSSALKDCYYVPCIVSPHYNKFRCEKCLERKF